MLGMIPSAQDILGIDPRQCLSVVLACHLAQLYCCGWFCSVPQCNVYVFQVLTMTATLKVITSIFGTLFRPEAMVR